MKIRSGFVTNSSSSSYIIALAQHQRLKVILLTGRTVDEILNQIPDRTSDMWNDGCDYKEEIDAQWYKDHYGWSDQEIDNKEMSENLEECKKIDQAIEEGKRVYHINISYHTRDDGVGDLFHDLVSALPEALLIDLS